MDTFLFIGDSLTYGYDVPRGLGWVELLERKWLIEEKRIKVDNQGVNGDTLQGIFYRLQRLQHTPYTHIFIMGGSNDILMGRDSQYCFRKLQEIYAFITQTWPNSRYYVGIPMENVVDDGHFNKSIIDYREAIVNEFREGVPTILDFYALLHNRLGAGETVYAGDVHPNVRGYQGMAEYAYKIIKMINKYK